MTSSTIPPWLRVEINPKPDEDECKSAILDWFADHGCWFSPPFSDEPENGCLLSDPKLTPFERLYFVPESALIALRMRHNVNKKRLCDLAGLLPGKNSYKKDELTLYYLPRRLQNENDNGDWNVPEPYRNMKEEDFCKMYPTYRLWVSIF